LSKGAAKEVFSIRFAANVGTNAWREFLWFLSEAKGSTKTMTGSSELHKATFLITRAIAEVKQKNQPQPEATSRRANTAALGFECFAKLLRSNA